MDVSVAATAAPGAAHRCAWFDNSAGVADDVPGASTGCASCRSSACTAADSPCPGSAGARAPWPWRRALYALRMFAVTAFYHRYFSHRSFKTSRAVQFLFALLGASARAARPALVGGASSPSSRARGSTRRCALAASARVPVEPHGLVPCARQLPARSSSWCPTCARSPSSRCSIGSMPLCRCCSPPRCTRAAPLLERFAPSLGTNGSQLLVWGFCRVDGGGVSRHLRDQLPRAPLRPPRFATRDDSRNNFALALLTFGEGWHNNHHRFPAAARQGFRWWEIDLTYYALRALARSGLIWDLRPVPVAIRARRPRTIRESTHEDRHRRCRHRRQHRCVRLARRARGHRVRGGRLHRRPHAHRSTSSSAARRYAVDTGFIVFND